MLWSNGVFALPWDFGVKETQESPTTMNPTRRCFRILSYFLLLGLVILNYFVIITSLKLSPIALLFCNHSACGDISISPSLCNILFIIKSLFFFFKKKVPMMLSQRVLFFIFICFIIIIFFINIIFKNSLIT